MPNFLSTYSLQSAKYLCYDPFRLFQLGMGGYTCFWGERAWKTKDVCNIRMLRFKDPHYVSYHSKLTVKSTLNSIRVLRVDKDIKGWNSQILHLKYECNVYSRPDNVKINQLHGRGATTACRAMYKRY